MQNNLDKNNISKCQNYVLDSKIKITSQNYIDDRYNFVIKHKELLK